MIIARLENLHHQIPALDRFRHALRYLTDTHLQNLPDGRYEIDAERIYAMVQSYQTISLEDAKFEAHRRYVDIQYMASGCERMGWATLAHMTVVHAYTPEKDVCLGTCLPENVSWIGVAQGMAAIFFPEDAHAPKIAWGESSAVKKIVLKVALDS